MDMLQEEIKSFHENIKPLLEKVLKQYSNETSKKIYNNIIKPCKKLIQKCSFKSVFDTSSLCSLTYWLYIYKQKEIALEICEHMRGVDFVFENTDSGIINIYGLEIRIARELLGENRKGSTTHNLLDYYYSKKVKKETCYPDILRKEEIASSCKAFLDTEILYALYSMIGKGETGLYIEINENWDKIEKTIIEYIDYIQKE